MNEVVRKKSPRAPSLSLDDAIERVMRVYDRERRHPAPTDVVAQHLGYKSANNGTALAALASLRSYGLLEKAGDGKLAVPREVEDYRFTPDESMKAALRKRWLETPTVFRDLLQKYGSGLPSDATLRFDLVGRGFSPASAETTLRIFKKSIAFSGVREDLQPEAATNAPNAIEESSSSTGSKGAAPVAVSHAPVSEGDAPTQSGLDRIPVRLSGGRRAWVEVPTPFFSADKGRLKAQIDLLLTDDDEP